MPACTNASNTLKEVFERHSSKMYIEFRHYPLPTLHPYAILCAVYSECAAQQGKFWPYHDRLFDEREELSRSMRVQGRLIDIAQELGLEMAQFRKCVQDPAVELTVLDEKSKGSDLGVKATPSYFINGQIYVGSNSLKKELDRILGEEK